jgi:hypothetical protein
MKRQTKHKALWTSEELDIENSNYKLDSEDFERLFQYVVRELTVRVISKSRLDQITTPDEIRAFVRQAAEKYDPKRFGNVAWYSFQRLRFLVGKWLRQKRSLPPTSS